MAEYINKIKAIDPHIIVGGNIDKPYYSIKYYDTSDNIWHVGFSSYELKFVAEWLKTEFDVVESEVEPVKRGKWIDLHNEDVLYEQTYKCSVCGEWFVLETGTPKENECNYCPKCGAKMDLEGEE